MSTKSNLKLNTLTDIKDFETELEFAIDLKLREQREQKVRQQQESKVQEIVEKKKQQKLRVLLFDFTNEFFETWADELDFPFKYRIVNDLKELTLALKVKTPTLLFLNYSLTPKAVEQLLPQIKVKFPHTQVIVTGHDLTPQVISKLKSPELSAKACLKVPCTLDEVLQYIN